MRVVTLFCDPCPEPIARAMISSVRKHMDCEIVQLTDLTTPKLDEVDAVQRLEGDIVSSVLARHLSMLDGETLYLDYDTVVQEDVSKVFEQDFDLAVTVRNERERNSDVLLYKVCPHNVGVMFSRSPEFWKQMAKRYDERTDKPAWFDFQIVLTESINVLKFKFLELPSERYNYTPEKITEDLSGRAIVHYKGHRKSWMVDDEEAEQAIRGNTMITKMFQEQGQYLTINQDHPLYKRDSNHPTPQVPT